MDERAPVLIEDDDPVIRQALRDWLQQDGYRVSEAQDGSEALYYIDHARHAVVIVADYAMPRLDGRALIEFVLGNGDMARRTALICMTAGDRILSPVFAGDLLARGIPVLRKPFDLAALSRAVEEAGARLRASVPATEPAPDEGMQ